MWLVSSREVVVVCDDWMEFVCRSIGLWRFWDEFGDGLCEIRWWTGLVCCWFGWCVDCAVLSGPLREFCEDGRLVVVLRFFWFKNLILAGSDSSLCVKTGWWILAWNLLSWLCCFGWWMLFVKIELQIVDDDSCAFFG